MKTLSVFGGSAVLATAVVVGALGCPQSATGGPSGPPGCAGGVLYGDAGLCCGPGFRVTEYNKCEGDPAPVSTTWAASLKDAGRDGH